MEQSYNPAEVESKWQKIWAERGAYNADLKKAKHPFYSLVMFPYPSGDKLHVGHWYNYAPADSFARYMRMKGMDVFSPMGFDAFGLPAENYAVKTRVHPAVSTAKNIETMIVQLKKIGCMYDWTKMVNTTDPRYYQWTQWLFVKMFEKELAYQKEGNVNFCPSCQTVLANEQCQDGACERCGTVVTQKPLKQWFWNIKKYAQRLLDGLEHLDWPEKTKLMQRNWIGRSEGAEVHFELVGTHRGVLVFSGDGAAASRVLTGDGAVSPDLLTGDEAVASRVLTGDGAAASRVLTGDLNRRLTDRPKGRIHSLRTCHVVFPPYKRMCFFDDKVSAQKILTILDGVCHRHDILLHEAAVMPDHIHLLISFDADRHLEMDIIKKLKGASAREFLADIDCGDRHLWAEGKHFEDILDERQFQTTLAYIQNNPEEANISPEGRILSRFPLQITVFTTRADTLFGATYLVLAPEHPMVDVITVANQRSRVEQYRLSIAQKTEIERTDHSKVKTGEFTGAYVINPANNERMPVWIADYALLHYGTGAVMAVPAHDERDYAFAQRYKLPMRYVVEPANKFAHSSDPLAADLNRLTQGDEQCWSGPGTLKESDFLNGLDVESGKRMMIEWLEKNHKGKGIISYRLRDWLVSRQRYWGAPIPIVYDPQGNPHPVPEEHLPWLLPTDVEFRPTGESPLRASKEFRARTERIFGKGWTPEFDTMDTFVCSSFYYLRYLMEGDEKVFIDPSKEKKWMPVSMYIGGPEHACMHLIYARFVMMALHDLGLVSQGEPFARLVHQGLITNKGAKMSKSKGNVVSPDSFIERYGSDVFRMYLMFMGPFTDGGDWSDTGIRGIDRFVQRIWRVLEVSLQMKNKSIKVVQEEADLDRLLHRTIQRVTESLDALHFNTAISALMELLNTIEKRGSTRRTALTFACLLAPLAPHLSEELWSVSGEKGSIVDQAWPAHDPSKLISATATVVVQVNGKLRGQIIIAADATKEVIIELAKVDPNVAKHLQGTVKKEIYVPMKLVNFVV